MTKVLRNQVFVHFNRKFGVCINQIHKKNLMTQLLLPWIPPNDFFGVIVTQSTFYNGSSFSLKFSNCALYCDFLYAFQTMIVLNGQSLNKFCLKRWPMLLQTLSFSCRDNLSYEVSILVFIQTIFIQSLYEPAAHLLTAVSKLSETLHAHCRLRNYNYTSMNFLFYVTR